MVDDSLSASTDEPVRAMDLAGTILERLGYDATESRIDELSARVVFTERASIWVSSGNALTETGFEGSGRRPPSVVVLTYRRPGGDAPVVSVSVTAYAPDARQRQMSHARSTTELQRVVRALRTIPEFD